MDVETFRVYELYNHDINGDFREVRGFRTLERAREFLAKHERASGLPCFIEWQLHRVSRQGREILEAQGVS